jgi:Dolichyl-phosphate-mannose-protein mannosyltransferase
LNLTPVLAWTSGSWVLPDGPLNAALAVGALCVASALFGGAPRAPCFWLGAGLAGGVAMMSKLHGVFLFAGVGLFLITQPRHRHWLKTPWPYAGVALALLVTLPFIIWNAEHQWLSFAFQAGRAHVRTITFTGPFLALAGQAAVLLPWLWLPLILCLVRAICNGPSRARDWLLVCLAIGPIVIFTLVSITGNRTLPHWASPGYLFLFPLLGRAVAEAIDKGDRLVRSWLAASTASIAAVLAAALALWYLPWPQMTYAQGKLVPNPIEEALDWKDLAQALKARGLSNRPGLFISATRWHEAGKIDLALGGALPVLCLCADPRGYGVIKRSSDYLGQDALIIGRGLTNGQVQSVYGSYFNVIEALPPVTITHAGRPAFELAVYSAQTLKQSRSRPNLIDALGLYGKRTP